MRLVLTLATVVALINAAGLITPLLYGRRSEEVLRKKLAVLVATAVMLAMAASPAVAAPGNNGRGAANANPNATFGIITAVENSGGGCDILC